MKARHLWSTDPEGREDGVDACRVALPNALPSPEPAAYMAVCFAAGPNCGSSHEFYPKLGELLRSGALQAASVAASVAPVLALAGCNYRDVPDDGYDEEAAIEAAHFQLPALPRSAANRALMPILVQNWGVTTNPHMLILDRATGRVLVGGGDMWPELLAIHQAQQRGGAAGLEPALGVWRAALVANVPASSPAPAAAPAPLTLRLRLVFGGSKPHVLASGYRVHPGSERLYVEEEMVRIRAGLLHRTTWIMFLQQNFRVFGDSFRMLFYMYPLVAWDMLGGAFVGVMPFTPYGVLASLVAHVLNRPLNWKPEAHKRFAWMIGFTMATICFVAYVGGLVGWWDKRVADAVVLVILTVCMTASWLEACAGWCLGCSVWNYVVVPLVSKYIGSPKVEECEVCEA